MSDRRRALMKATEVDRAAVEYAAKILADTIIKRVPSCPYRDTALSYIRDVRALCDTAMMDAKRGRL